MRRPLLLLFPLALQAAPFDQSLYDQKARTYTPEEALKTFELPAGYHLEIAAAEPLVSEPVAIAWDGDGNLYVAEMNTYMQDIDGKNQHAPTSRIVLLKDTDNDGAYETRTVFIDKLVLPRMIQPLDDRVLVRETNTFDLHTYRDTDGDGVADEKTLVYEGGNRGGNLEHQPSGLDWNIDNWMYTTYTRKRYRWAGDHIEAEDLPHGSGQWGITHDDTGRIFYSTAGGENPAMDFQRPIIYGRISLNGEKSQDFREVFPIVPIPDVQGGGGRYRRDSLTLNNFTGCAGQHVYRGDRLPSDLYGDLFIPEPVGRLIRRAKVTNDAGKIVLSNATPGTEFIRSSDANFRPLNMATGPDGCLYIVDMYRGIIQEGNWVRPGSYLRGVVEEHGLDKNIGRGRIYRLVHNSTKRDKHPKLLSASTSQLVNYLAHPNGWYRDTAQKLIVVRSDQSAIPALTKLATDHRNPIARLHALWTLDGLGATDLRLLGQKFSDRDPHVRAAAIRLTEPLLLAGDTRIVPVIEKLQSDTSPDVVIQLALTLSRTAPEGADQLLTSIRSRHKNNHAITNITDAVATRIKEAEQVKLKNVLFAKGKATYETLCMTCHGLDAKGAPVAGQPGLVLGPPLTNSPRANGKKDIPIRILLKGMTGELDGKTYPGPMLPLESYDDEYLASVLTYVRGSFGNKASPVSPADVAAVRASIADRKEPYLSSEILAMQPVPSSQMRRWKITASHNSGSVKSAIDGNPGSRWDTGGSQTPGMWFQFDMGEPHSLSSIVLDAAKSTADYPRGYQVQFSTDGKTWSGPVTAANGTSPTTDIVLPPTPTQHVRITQTGRANGKFWSIHNLQVFLNN